MFINIIKYLAGNEQYIQVNQKLSIKKSKRQNDSSEIRQEIVFSLMFLVIKPINQASTSDYKLLSSNERRWS